MKTPCLPLVQTWTRRSLDVCRERVRFFRVSNVGDRVCFGLTVVGTSKCGATRTNFRERPGRFKYCTKGGRLVIVGRRRLAASAQAGLRVQWKDLHLAEAMWNTPAPTRSFGDFKRSTLATMEWAACLWLALSLLWLSATTGLHRIDENAPLAAQYRRLLVVPT